MARLCGIEFGVFLSDATKNWLVGSALRVSPFASLGAFARKRNPNVGSALRASPFERRKCPGPTFFPVRYLPRGLGRAALDSEYAECFITCSLLLVFDTQAYQHMSKHVRRNFTCFVLCLGEYVFDTAFSGRQIGFASSRSDVMKLCNRYK